MPASRVLSGLLVTLQFFFAAAATPFARQTVREQVEALNWTKGPTSASMFGVASIQIPDGYMLLGSGDAAKFMTLTHNLGGEETFVFAPVDLHWWSELSFSPSGYVKDDEKIDPAGILQTVTRATDAGNKERRTRGWPTMSVLGWKLSPFYDAETKRLEWAIRGKDDVDNSESINFNTRILGRSGVTSATLIVDPEAFEAGVAEFKAALRAYEYSTSENYSAFRPGDKVAEYGLTALIVGGAAAVATKTGFWKLFGASLLAAWKLVLAAIAGLSAAVKKLFNRKKQ